MDPAPQVQSDALMYFACSSLAADALAALDLMDSIFLADLDWPPILPASLTQAYDDVELIGGNLT